MDLCWCEAWKLDPSLIVLALVLNCAALVSTLSTLRQEDCTFKVCLGCTARPSFKKLRVVDAGVHGRETGY